MLRTGNITALALVACLAAACDRGPETIKKRSDRFARLVEKMPISDGRVQGTYTFDLSNMGPDRLEQLGVTGLSGGGRPISMAANQNSDAVRKEFDAARVGPRGLLIIAQSSVLLRIPTRSHQSASDAVQNGYSRTDSWVASRAANGRKWMVCETAGFS